jgi:hypothetical protein
MNFLSVNILQFSLFFFISYAGPRILLYTFLSKCSVVFYHSLLVYIQIYEHIHTCIYIYIYSIDYLALLMLFMETIYTYCLYKQKNCFSVSMTSWTIMFRETNAIYCKTK